MEVVWEPETGIFEKRMTQIQLVQLIPSFSPSQEKTDEWIVSRLDINLANYLGIPRKTSEEFFRMDLQHIILAMELTCCWLDGKKSKRNGENSMRRVFSFVSPLHLENSKAADTLSTNSIGQQVERVSDHLNIMKSDRYVKLQNFWSKLSNYPNMNGRQGMTTWVSRNNDPTESTAQDNISLEDCSSDDISNTVHCACKACRLLCVLAGYADKTETSVEERLLVQKVRRYCPSLQRIVQQCLKECPHIDRMNKFSSSLSETSMPLSNYEGGIRNFQNLQWLPSNSQQQEQRNIRELEQQLVETKVALAEALEQLDYVCPRRRH